MSSQTLRLLLVDDDEDDRLIIEDFLREIESTQYHVTWSSDFLSALEATASRDYDICLVDFRLGEHTGLELLGEFRSRGFAAPCILLTGQGDYEIDIEAMRSGASDYLLKDQINAPMLERSIRYAITQKNAERSLRESEAQLRFMTAKLLSVQEDERRKVAAQLHDNLGQVLTAIKLGIENTLIHMAGGNATPELLTPLVPALQESIEEVRRIYTYLRPSLLDDLGILATMSWVLREFLKHNPAIRVESRLFCREEDVPSDLKVVIFRILQDALENVSRHSDAKSLEVTLGKRENVLYLRIEDNGRGFDVDAVLAPGAVPPGLGLISIRERVNFSRGRCTVASAADQGTRIDISWPV